MKSKKEVLNTLFIRAKKAIKDGDEDLARDSADMGLVYAAIQRQEGADIEDIIEGVPIKTWLMRFWVFLENNGLLLDETNSDSCELGTTLK